MVRIWGWESMNLTFSKHFWWRGLKHWSIPWWFFGYLWFARFMQSHSFCDGDITISQLGRTLLEGNWKERQRERSLLLLCRISLSYFFFYVRCLSSKPSFGGDEAYQKRVMTSQLRWPGAYQALQQGHSILASTLCGCGTLNAPRYSTISTTKWPPNSTPW